MIVTMMLPGTLLLFDRVLHKEPWRLGSTAPAVLGYLAVWTGFGVFAFWACLRAYTSLRR